MKLKGKVAFISGAGRGLGRASAIAMSREGAKVFCISRTTDELLETVRLCREACGEAAAMAADVSKPGEVEAAFKEAVSSFGGVDILMNNAAIIGPLKHTWKTSQKEWDYALAVDLMGVITCSRLAVPLMLERGGGKIINVISGLAFHALPPLGAYSVAKAGVAHLTRIMAEELRGHNIQVNGLDPGVMDTRMQDEIRAFSREELGDEVYERFHELKSEGLLAPPERSARLALWLASPGSDAVTGENLGAEGYAALGFRD
jgi:NAD(P)-dependent dehydrogenase (short-subunit alcohol dehydrogenase family)